MSGSWFLSITWKNLARRPARSLILPLCVAAVAGLQVSAALIDRASRASLELGVKRLGADLVAVPRGMDRAMTGNFLKGGSEVFYMDRSVQNKIAGFGFVSRTSAQLFLKSLENASCCSMWNVFLVGFEPESDFAIRPWLEGHPDISLGKDDVLAGAAIGAKKGDVFKFFGHDFRVAGVLSKTGMGMDSSVFIPLQTAYRMAEESTGKAEKPLDISSQNISALMIRLKPEKDGGLPGYQAAFKLEQAVPEVSIIQPDELSERTRRNLNFSLSGLRTAGYAVWPITALLIGLVFALTTNERQGEIGINRAVGATKRDIFRMIIFEACAITGAGAILGCAASSAIVAGFSSLIAKNLDTPFLLPAVNDYLSLFAAAFLLSVLSGVLAALYPAYRASRMEPMEAIRSQN
jgi:putative ABC transport system permease protein